MGWGDEIMASGDARCAQERDPRPVVVIDRNGKVRAHDIWRGNPRITQVEEGAQELQNGPGMRPYIKAKSYSQWRWRAGRCNRGEIYFNQDELEFAKNLSPGIIIEPNLKDRAPTNKDWGKDHWKSLSGMLLSAGYQVSQLGPAGTAVVASGVSLIPTPTFRHACAALSKATAAILPEGGLHHAAAALNIRAVVIFGCYISPEVTGYSDHLNIFRGDGLGCGMRSKSSCCTKVMASISSQFVFDKLQKLLGVPAK